MAFFVVTMSHPDGPEWASHLRPHVDYPRNLIEQGKVRASGRAIGLPLRSGLIVSQVADRAGLDRLIADDPAARAGIIVEMSATEWDPPFGIFARDSSGHAPEID